MCTGTLYRGGGHYVRVHHEEGKRELGCNRTVEDPHLRGHVDEVVLAVARLGVGARHAGAQGLPLVHFSAQPEPFLTHEIPLNA
jgi:hypothetical protein